MDRVAPARAEALIARETAFGAQNYKPLDVVLTRGEGVYVFDVEGRRYLDCLAAYSAVNHGHCHPRLVAALTRQAGQLALTSRAFRNDQLADYYAELCALTNGRKVLPMNTGAEAVETALKVVRKWGYEVKGVPADQAQIIVADGNFHGRTLGIIGFSSDPLARRNFGPFAPGFVTVPYGSAAAVAEAITPTTVAILVEPIQGEAGVVIPPAGYLAELRALATHHSVALVFDEVQTGLGRTGRLLAEDHEGVEADLVLLGKALGGGLYPVSAVVARGDMLDVLRPGEHGSTFGGNPLACAVAREALRVLVEEDLIDRSARVGARLLANLAAVVGPSVKALRGRGLMIAVELLPDAGGARQVCERLRERGLLAKETHDHTIRVSPPLILTDAEADWIADQFDAVL
jgi:ornithine--oxo-acid transaminase